MASRRVLASVADGVARAFTSRDNDVDGWQAVGLLMDAGAPADPAYELDLLTGKTTPRNLTSALDELGPAWARYFAWTLARHGVPPDRIATATLTLRFEYAPWPPSVRPGGDRRPFVCNVLIRDDRGRDYERSEAGTVSRPRDFDPSEPPAGKLRRSSPPYDAGRIEMRIT
jgi:hypothetical protein